MRQATSRAKRVSARDIGAVAERIVTQFRPDKIILFGSHAYGRPTADSDVDLLIVMNTRLRPRQQRLAISRALSPHPFPMDIVVKTPQEMSRRIALGDAFLRHIAEHGEVLYERSRR